MELAVVLEKGEDGYVVAECPTLPGCVSQGKTESEALRNIKEAIAGWLAVEREKIEEESPADVKVVCVKV